MKDWSTRTPQENEGEFRCSGWLSSSCSISATRHVTLVIMWSVMNDERTYTLSEIVIVYLNVLTNNSVFTKTDAYLINKEHINNTFSSKTLHSPNLFLKPDRVIPPKPRFVLLLLLLPQVKDYVRGCTWQLLKSLTGFLYQYLIKETTVLNVSTGRPTTVLSHSIGSTSVFQSDIVQGNNYYFLLCVLQWWKMKDGKCKCRECLKGGRILSFFCVFFCSFSNLPTSTFGGWFNPYC
jgi:hypothetical protein